MTRPLLACVGLVTVATMSLAQVAAAGQTPPPGTRASQPAKPYAPPRTPDGQPDIQGFWTNSTYTPLQRPKGVTKAFYTPAEAIEAEKRAAANESELTTPGTIADVHYDFSQFGLDKSQSKLARNLRTSLIVDPENGRLPPLSTEGQKRAAEAAELAKRVGRWDSAQSNQLDDRCIIMVGSGPPMLNAAYNANYQIVQAPGYVMILTEMIHDVRIIPLDAACTAPRQYPAVDRALARTVGRQHPGRRDDQLQRQESAGRLEREHAGDGAVHARGRRRDPVHLHRRGSLDMDEAVDRGNAHGDDDGTALRARLPRGELRPVQHARRRPARREEGGRSRSFLAREVDPAKKKPAWPLAKPCR